MVSLSTTAKPQIASYKWDLLALVAKEVIVPVKFVVLGHTLCILKLANLSLKNIYTNTTFLKLWLRTLTCVFKMMNNLFYCIPCRSDLEFYTWSATPFNHDPLLAEMIDL